MFSPGRPPLGSVRLDLVEFFECAVELVMRGWWQGAQVGHRGHDFLGCECLKDLSPWLILARPTRQMSSRELNIGLCCGWLGVRNKRGLSPQRIV